MSYWSVLAHLEIIFRKCFKVTPFRLNGVFGDHFSRLPGEVCVCVQDSLHKQRFLQATSILTKMFQSDTVQALRCQIGVFWRIWTSFFTPPRGGVRPRAGPAAQTKVQCVCVQDSLHKQRFRVCVQSIEERQKCSVCGAGFTARIEV